jgi:hypothetical protein
MYLVSQSLEICIFRCHLFGLKKKQLSKSEKAETLICFEELLYKVWRNHTLISEKP